MKIFGFVMILAMIQLFAVGSVIQRGNYSLLPDVMKKGVTNMPAYCRRVGNKLILLSLIALFCGISSFMYGSVYDPKPILFFGIGMVLVLVLLFFDHKKFSK